MILYPRVMPANGFVMRFKKRRRREIGKVVGERAAGEDGWMDGWMDDDDDDDDDG